MTLIYLARIMTFDIQIQFIFQMYDTFLFHQKLSNNGYLPLQKMSNVTYEKLKKLFRDIQITNKNIGMRLQNGIW